jgi:AraC-like DNA-binding protein
MGFASQSTFTYAFRRATGVTPVHFRTRAWQDAKVAWRPAQIDEEPPLGQRHGSASHGPLSASQP